jgi:two-component system, chemotaxis family, CheB/CheR fusion protein
MSDDTGIETEVGSGDGAPEATGEPDIIDTSGLDELLEFLHKNRGFDFTGYKRASLVRRIRRRMQGLNINGFSTYLDHLHVHPDEFPQLFNMLLINVTAFFRDPPAWSALAKRLPSIIEKSGGGSGDDNDAPIRVWSAGCSSGEEPYTLAMILCDILGPEAFTRRVKIYATDVDEDALAHARQATYNLKSLEAVPPSFIEKYFTRSGASYQFNKDLRRAVIFGRHDLVQDAPIPRVDILTCRNSLMYFNAETQTRILQRLQFALNAPHGVLLLGKAEMLLTHSDLFTPIDLKLRLFGRATATTKSRGSRAVVAAEKNAAAQAAADAKQLQQSANGANGANGADGDDVIFHKLIHASFDCSPLAQLVLDSSNRLALVNHHAAHTFSLSPNDIGRPFSELELSYKPAAELRSCIDRVKLERRPVHLREVERVLASEARNYLDIDVLPLLSNAGVFVGTLISFLDVTGSRRLQGELRRANGELGAAHEELQSTSEELETTNEELQSTVEELETTNEELQSTNEELETMNEELQSTNEELQTMNEELRQRGNELNEMNSFYGAVLGSLRAGVAVLDRELRVKTWNERMEDLWGERADEMEGKHFLNLDIGLPIDRLTPGLRHVLSNGGSFDETLECTNRRGKTITCRVTVTQLESEEMKGLIIWIEEQQGVAT